MEREHLSPKIKRVKFRIKRILLESKDPLNDIIVSYYVGMTLGYGTKRNKVDFSALEEEAFLMNRKDSAIFLRFLKKYIREFHCLFERERVEL